MNTFLISFITIQYGNILQSCKFSKFLKKNLYFFGNEQYIDIAALINVELIYICSIFKPKRHCISEIALALVL